MLLFGAPRTLHLLWFLSLGCLGGGCNFLVAAAAAVSADRQDDPPNESSSAALPQGPRTQCPVRLFSVGEDDGSLHLDPEGLRYLETAVGGSETKGNLLA